jgi:hypothetical protein
MNPPLMHKVKIVHLDITDCGPTLDDIVVTKRAPTKHSTHRAVDPNL